MPIRRRAEGSWIVDVRVRGKRYRKTYPATMLKRDVASIERQWLAELERPEQRHATATVGKIINRYWTEKACHLGDSGHQDTYLTMWGEALGTETPIARVQADHIAAILARWRSDVSDSTVNRRMAALRACWRWAADVWGVPVASVPWRRMRLTEPEPGDRSVGQEKRSDLLSGWPARSKDIVRLALATGLRLGALLRLERRDVDLDRRIIRTVTKGRAGGKEVTAPITGEVEGILDDMNMPEVGRLFSLKRHEVRRDREIARRAAGLDGFRFHDLRHCFAQDLEDAGYGDTVTAALHHSSPTLRKRYSHARLDRTREAIEAARGHRTGTAKAGSQ